MSFDKSLLNLGNIEEKEDNFSKQDFSAFSSDAEAYHHLVLNLIKKQKKINTVDSKWIKCEQNLCGWRV